MSTKMVGETSKVIVMQSLADTTNVSVSYFEKANDASSGSKGDFILETMRMKSR